MNRSTWILMLLSLLTGSGGCAMCCAPDDYAYSAYGGRWQRHDMYHGRVGSAFAPAGGDVLSSPLPEEVPFESDESPFEEETPFEEYEPETEELPPSVPALFSP
jgi:hypothetical protein